jgi:phosphopantothenoylcysteine decarboxylase/phosphopantothenate--cysteine ligase
MGVALATAAWARGADATLVAGPLEVARPDGPRVVDVETTDEMRDVVAAELPRSDILIMAAAPADFGSAKVAEGKLRKSALADGGMLELAPTADILRSTRACRKAGAVIVGFALETDDVIEGARAKLVGKDLDLVVVNDAREPGAGFGVATNRVTILGRNGSEEALPLLSKEDVAHEILDCVLRLAPRG